MTALTLEAFSRQGDTALYYRSTINWTFIDNNIAPMYTTKGKELHYYHIFPFPQERLHGGAVDPVDAEEAVRESQHEK